ncbi:NADP-dependent oxidoreductase [Oxalobacteraceae bacterium CAVE-383]|nr:NADP-dependent oxidoreductase [Oxalobacteraceae bacterium CAVE-383]
MSSTCTQSDKINRRIILVARPRGLPTPDNFRLDHVGVPTPRDGQLLLRTIYLSLDPYMRGRMSDAPSYAPPVELEHVMVGGAVSRVVQSLHPDYAPGDLVVGSTGWQDYALSNGENLKRLPAGMARPSHALGVLGMPGFSAYAGLLEIGRPRAGETLAVAAATGGVGSLVGQIAKIKGCRIVGIAGGADKCRFAVEQLGFDACVDHRAADFAQQLAAACPRGIDIYFENVGGAVLDAVLPLLNLHARIPLCGLMSQLGSSRPPQEGPDKLPQFLRLALIRRFTIRGFINYDFEATHYEAFQRDMQAWLNAGLVRYREDIVNGLEAAPEAFIGLLQGANFGKLLVQVGEH